jgi:hypothetical protein
VYTKTINKVQEKQVGLKSDGTHQLLVYADDVNLLGDKLDITEESTKALIEATSSKEVGLDVNTEKAKYMLSHHVTRMQGKIMTQR